MQRVHAAVTRSAAQRDTRDYVNVAMEYPNADLPMV